MTETFHLPERGHITVSSLTPREGGDAQRIISYFFPGEDAYDNTRTKQQARILSRLEVKGHRFYSARVEEMYNAPVIGGMLQTSSKILGLRTNIPGISRLTQMHVVNLFTHEGRLSEAPELDVEAALLYSASRDYSSIGRVSVAAPLELRVGGIGAGEAALSAAGLRAVLLEQRPWLAQNHLAEA